MSKDFNMEFCQVLCARICHDLISPVGAINSGIELMEDCASVNNQEVLELIAQSAKSAMDKLVLFRLAMGSGSGIACLHDLYAQLIKSIDHNKFPLEWSIPMGMELDENVMKTWSKLITNMILLLIEAAPYGGQILVELSAPHCNSLRFKLMSDTIFLSQDIIDLLQSDDGCEKVTPKNVYAALIFFLATKLEQNARINFSNPRELIVEFKAL